MELGEVGEGERFPPALGSCRCWICCGDGGFLLGWSVGELLAPSLFIAVDRVFTRRGETKGCYT